MNRNLLVLCGIVVLSLVVGCKNVVPPAIRAETNLNNQVTVDWTVLIRLRCIPLLYNYLLCTNQPTDTFISKHSFPISE